MIGIVRRTAEARRAQRREAEDKLRLAAMVEAWEADFFARIFAMSEGEFRDYREAFLEAAKRITEAGAPYASGEYQRRFREAAFLIANERAKAKEGAQ